ncbi:hypothetical protein LUZ63_009244 [Rhynchospora breviuscula]|uniref:Protein LAZ1 n=1 Tax=Rhynchospora breviuscula TaxID=2022672 RepID=A0A9Q0HND5_9POAL|nr:hypothetical protein LUZ63_009244 [Rhynchospora breviuscula]
MRELHTSLSAYAPPTWAIVIASIFLVITLCLSTFLLFSHLTAYNNPEEQKFLIGVILMVPCYAIESYISLLHPSISVDIEILRDCYESFAMYCFGRYLVACLGGEERTIKFLEHEGGSVPGIGTPLLENNDERAFVKHPFPMNYLLKPWRLGEQFYFVIKLGIIQYMIIKAVTAILAVILEAFGAYCEGEFKWNCGYPYMAIVINFSQTWALYCLVQFYAVIKDELAHIKPLAKFLVFKSIVFLTWWQDVAIAILFSMGFLKGPIAEALQFKSSIQDFIICIEMGVASIVHIFVFPSKPYELIGDRFVGDVSVLGDYASVNCQVDPDEVRDSERPTKLRLPHPEARIKSGTTIRESVRDVVLGGGEYIAKDLKFTMNQAVEPMEKGFTRINERLHKISQKIKKHDKKRTKDDSCIVSPPSLKKSIRGIDDPILNGSFSDSGTTSGRRRHKRRLGYASGETGESSDQGSGGFEIRGHRWVTKD